MLLLRTAAPGPAPQITFHTKPTRSLWKIVLLKMVGRPAWWALVNFAAALLACIDLAKSFGKGASLSIGLALLGFVFAPILAFGSATYQGPAAQQSAAPAFG